MKSKKYLLGLVSLFLFFLVQTASAVDVEIEIKDKFFAGEKVSFNYTFLSDEDVEIRYLPYVNCPNAPSSLLEFRDARIVEGVLLESEYVYLSQVDSLAGSQSCVAGVAILDPNVIEEGSFEIINDNYEMLNFNLLSCGDSGCSNMKSVFSLGDVVYLDYNSNFEELNFSSKVFYPDGSSEDLSLPDKIDAEYVGIYSIKSIISLGKENKEFESEFVVSSNEVDIPYSSPSKVVRSSKSSNEKVGINFFVIVLFLIVAILAFLLIIKNRKHNIKKSIKKKTK